MTLKFTKGVIRDLRKSPEINGFVKEIAEQVAEKAGPGFKAKRAQGRNRARYTVVPTTPDAYKANHESLAVIRALGKV